MLKSIDSQRVKHNFAIISAFPSGSVIKNQPASARDTCSIPGLGRSWEKEMATCSSYSCLRHPMNRGAWWAIVQRVTRVRHDLVTKQQTTSGYLTIHFRIFVSFSGHWIRLTSLEFPESCWGFFPLFCRWTKLLAQIQKFLISPGHVIFPVSSKSILQ